MSNETRASLEAMQRLAGAVILQLAPHRSDDPHAGGALDIALALQRAGARPLVASGNGPFVRELAAAGIEWIDIHHDSANPFRLRRNASRLERLIAARRVDIIHAYSAGAAWSALAATERAPVWLVTNLPDDVPRRSLAALHRTALARGDHIIAHSAFAAAPLIQRFAIAREQVTVIPNRIDDALFDPATMRPERVLALRTAWKIPKGNRVMLVPGPLAPAAGQSILIDAVRRVAREKLRDITFVLLGDVRTNKAYARQVMHEIAAHPHDLFRLGGRCDDWPAALAAADFVVMPALEPQTFGRPIPESQAMARPVIASAIGILPENILAPPRMPKALRTGWLVPPGDAQALTDTLNEALGFDLAAYRALAARARQFAQFMFSPQNVAASVVNIYSGLLAGRR